MIKNIDILSKDFVNSDKYVLTFDEYEKKEANEKTEYHINLKGINPAAGFDVGNESLDIKKLGDTPYRTIAGGILPVFGDKYLIGKRPENVFGNPNKWICGCGRTSENPLETPMKELIEEFVVLVKRDNEERFLFFGDNEDHKQILNSVSRTQGFNGRAYKYFKPNKKEIEMPHKIVFYLDNQVIGSFENVYMFESPSGNLTFTLVYEYDLEGWSISDCCFTENKETGEYKLVTKQDLNSFDLIQFLKETFEYL